MARSKRKEVLQEETKDWTLEEKIASVSHLKPLGKLIRLRMMGVPEVDLPPEAKEALEEKKQLLIKNNPSGVFAKKAIAASEQRINQIVRMELDEGKSQAEIAASLDITPKTLFEYKKAHKALLQEAYTRQLEDVKTQHLSGYLRGRKKLASLMGPAADRLEKEITIGESSGVATRAAIAVAKMVLDQDKGGGTAFLLDDDSRVIWERVRTEDPIVDAEIIEPKALPSET